MEQFNSLVERCLHLWTLTIFSSNKHSSETVIMAFLYGLGGSPNTRI